MTDRAGRLVQAQFSGRMRVQEIGRVVGRLQVSALSVALFATERIVDLAVADQAIRHLRHRDRPRRVRLCEATMTRLTGVFRVQESPEITRWL